jgi:integrative and conjugative element protein (TIGR02256 family)
MDLSKFSFRLQVFDGEITNTSLRDTINSLKVNSDQIFQWDAERIAVSVEMKVDLPPLGNFQGVDIRSVEPILLVFHLSEYPTDPPKAYPDRIDFPKNSLAHLYVAVNDKPPGFCLVRGGLKEWYANKRISDLIIRIQNWLRDAAAGVLTVDGDEFDPLRLEGYSGTVVYDYDAIVKVAQENQSFHPDSNFALAFFERTHEGSLTFTFQNFITKQNIENTLEVFIKEKAKDQTSASTKKFNFGYILWSLQNDVFDEYDVSLPGDLTSFRAYCTKYKIDFSALERYIAAEDLNNTVLIPVILAIKRPRKIIGYSSNIEFINFYLRVDSPDVEEGAIINNVPVKFQSHNQPLTVEKALKISGLGEAIPGINLVFGCGALGSKVVMHFARSGIVNNLLFDPDNFSSHNLVRHTLLSNHVGMNKAMALEQVIKQIFYSQKLFTFNASRIEKEFLKDELVNKCTWIFDFTASMAFFQRLVNLKNIKGPTLSCGFITHFGKLGILFIEGKDRTPRIDDLKALLYDNYKSHTFISEWLKEEANGANSGLIEVNVGVGCNSETIVLSDEIVSLHAAFFASVIKNEMRHNSGRARMYISKVSNSDSFGVSTYELDIPPLTTLTPLNDPSWEVRIKKSILEVLKSQMGLAMPRETGGVLIGRANYKTKTIHVTDVILEPPDSRSNHVCFFRGIAGLSDEVDVINRESGNQLGYIGEWHTHPFGPDEMSDTDYRTIRKFRRQFNELSSPLPVFLLIVTPTIIVTYVY